MKSSLWFGLFTTGCLTLSIASALACGSASSGPTDNPVYTKYGSTSYTWTANIKWSCVYNVNDYSGSTATAKFNAARDAASANGGGVVYFPSGTHSFSDNIYLKNGVVIRGATPSSSDAKSSTYSPSSKLVFPKYNQSLSGSGTAKTTAFKYISTTSQDSDSNIGVVNIDINRAAIKLLGNPDTGSNRNLVILGVRSNNVGEADPTVPTSWQNAWQRYMYRFSANIKLQANANILVANNRLNDAVTDSYDQPNYKVKDGTNVLTLTTGSQARFDYADHYGIDVNIKSGHQWYATPTLEPSMFRTGIVIRDNYVYHTRRVAINAAGQGLQVNNNVIRDKSGKVGWVDATGQKKLVGGNTLENRGIDVSGYDVICDGNDYQVYQHIVGWTTQYSTTDGEGMMQDNVGTMVNGWTVRNNKGNKPIMIYKTKDVNNVYIASNTISGTHPNLPSQSMYLNANTNGSNHIVRNSRIQSNRFERGIIFYGDGGTGSGNSIQNNTATASATIDYSCETAASISGNTGFTVNACK